MIINNNFRFINLFKQLFLHLGMASYDIIGSIAIMKFSGKSKKEKLKAAKQLLKRQNIKTVLEKTEKIKGRLRTFKTKFLCGEKTKVALHKENNCKFKMNVETCYFSPRLAEERKEIASKIRKQDKVLVMFSGVAPFPIVISKLSRAGEVTAIELSRECNKYAHENLKLNKINNIKLIQGDVKKIIKKDNKKLGKFSVIVMARPNLRESFLKQAFLVSKKGTMIYYHGFCHENELNKMLEEIYRESKKSKKKIQILKIKKAGNIAPYKYRYRIEIKVVN